MPDFGMRSNGDGRESLDAIARTDQLLDALAGQRRVPPGDAGEAALFTLLEDWRDDVRWPPVTDLVTERDAAAALQDGLTARPGKRGRPRGLSIVASIAAAVLCIGGFGAVVGSAGPGDSLYGLRTALFGEAQSVRDDRVTLAAQTEMAQVQQMIDQGDWEQAQQKLQAVSTQVQTVDDFDAKTDLIQQWNELSVKVGTRDPAATLPPPAAPGAPAPAPPPGVTLLELPPVTTTTSTATTSATTSTPPSTEATSAETPPSESTVPQTPPSEAFTVPPSTEVPAAPSSAVGIPPPPSTGQPTSPAAAVTSAPTTNTSSVPPSAPAQRSAPAEVSTSVEAAVSAQPPSAVVTVTTPMPPAAATHSEESETARIGSGPSAVNPPQPPAQAPQPQQKPNVVITTVPLPLPQLGVPGLN